MSRKPTPAPSPIAELRANLDSLMEQTAATTLSAPRRRALEKEIRAVIQELGSFLNTLDPIRQPSAVFDPSNPKVVGRFVSLALVAQQRHPLAEIPRFYGSGIYAIYYNGPFPLYAPISGSETPIYVGRPRRRSTTRARRWNRDRGFVVGCPITARTSARPPRRWTGGFRVSLARGAERMGDGRRGLHDPPVPTDLEQRDEHPLWLGQAWRRRHHPRQ
ncbi:hypothetical protein SPKIRA_37870 (plasmid) [Sphingomonas paucimobilis]|nr:hypothetical protein SPKIRA_37870 [Sphingomonas paucimobilis]